MIVLSSEKNILTYLLKLKSLDLLINQDSSLRKVWGKTFFSDPLLVGQTWKNESHLKKMGHTWKKMGHTLENSSHWEKNGLHLKAVANEDTLLRTHCCRHICFPVCPRAQQLLRTQILSLFRNILCLQQMFPSLRGRRNIMGNNVSATMCPRLPGPLQINFVVSLAVLLWIRTTDERKKDHKYKEVCRQ